MKNLNKFLMLLTSAALLVTSCVEPTNETVNAELTVSGGTAIVVKGADAEGTVTVTASAAVENDVTVSFVASPANGEAVIAKEVVIAKGATSASTKVTFPLAKFPKNAPQVKITITGSSTPGVKFATSSTEFLVSGESSSVNTITASLIAEGSVAFTVNGVDVKKKINVKLTNAHTVPVTVNLVANVTSGAGTATLEATSIVIPAGANMVSTNLLFSASNFPEKGVPTVIDVVATSAEMAFVVEKLTYTARCFDPDEILASYCQIGGTGYSYASIGGVEVGGATLRAANIDGVYNEYIDYTQDTDTRASIKAGTNVNIKFRNMGTQGFCGKGDTFEAVVYIDWNKDGDFADAGEKASRKAFTVTVDADGIQELVLPISTIPADAQKTSTMRILTHFLGAATKDGCQALESGNAYDVVYILE